jgi:hypothetical protein
MSGWVAGAVVVTGVASGIMSSNAATDAANIQSGALDRATAVQQQSLDRQLEMQRPFTEAGTTAVNQLSAMTQPGGSATQDFSYEPFDYQADPGYQFRLDRGLRAMNQTAASRGGLISGNALKAGQQYGQDMGSQEYGASFERYLQNYANAQNTFQMNRNNLLDPLKFLTNIGQAGASNQAANVGSFGSSQAANITGAGNVQAAGQIGSANAFTGAMGQGIGQLQMNSLINNRQSTYAPPQQPNYFSGGGGYTPDFTSSPNFGGNNML